MKTGFKMKAIGFYENLPIDDENSLVDLTIEKPTAKGKDLLVKVMAIAVNPVDYKMRKNRPSENPPQILGWDVAGIVEEVGEGCQLFAPGDEVYYAGDITKQGGNSEFHLVDERIVGNKPKTLDFNQAAAIKPQGTICSIVDTDSKVDLNLMKSKSVGFIWEFMFTRSMFNTEDMVNQGHLLNDIANMIDDNKIKTTINKILSPINAKNLRKAHKSLEEGRTIGKIVLTEF